MSDHVSRSALEAYVMGVLEDADIATFEAHITSCALCAAKLAREARLELAFTAVAESVADERPHRITKTLVFPAFGAALAVAAAVLLWMVPRAQSTDDQAPIVEMSSTHVDADASSVTASLDLQADGSRVGVRD